MWLRQIDAFDVILDLLVYYGPDSRQVEAFLDSQRHSPEVMEVLETCVRVKRAFPDGVIELPFELQGDRTSGREE